jgi:hypothetical protein
MGEGRVRYENVTEPGVVAVRNHALEQAHTDLLVFIDDDELPQEGWLLSLVATWQATGAAAVKGRVESVFEPPLRGWVADANFWYRPRAATGTPLREANSGNLLLDLRQVRRHGLRFSAQFGLSGGEDSDFSRALVERGGQIVACDESVVADVVPTERMSLRWLAMRFLSHGNTHCLVDVAHARGRGRRLTRRAAHFAGGGVRVALGAVCLATGHAVSSTPLRAKGFRWACRGAGLVLASFGFVYQEYSRHGRRLRPWRG